MDARDIAEGLDSQMRNAILRTRGPDEDGLYWFDLGSARGLPVELKQRTVVGHCLTPLGIAVRQHLEVKP